MFCSQFDTNLVSIPCRIFSEWGVRKYHVDHWNYSQVCCCCNQTIFVTIELEGKLNLVIPLDRTSYIPKVIPETEKKLWNYLHGLLMLTQQLIEFKKIYLFSVSTNMIGVSCESAYIRDAWDAMADIAPACVDFATPFTGKENQRCSNVIATVMWSNWLRNKFPNLIKGIEIYTPSPGWDRCTQKEICYWSVERSWNWKKGFWNEWKKIWKRKKLFGEQRNIHSQKTTFLTHFDENQSSRSVPQLQIVLDNLWSWRLASLQEHRIFGMIKPRVSKTKVLAA